MGTRVRGFSIVFHNVKNDSKSPVEAHFKNTKPAELLVALEPYPKGEGFHIHVYVSYKNPRFFDKTLSSCIELSKNIIQPRPEGEVRDWGRVEVDRMRGTFKEATAYLTNPKKEKECDPEVTHTKADEVECDICGCRAPAPFMRCQFADDLTMGRCHKCHLKRLTPPKYPRIALSPWEI